MMKHVQNNPCGINRRAPDALGSFITTIHKILRRIRLYPDILVQELIQLACLTRVEFSNWFLDNTIAHSILWTTEATFKITTALNFHKTCKFIKS